MDFNLQRTSGLHCRNFLSDWNLLPHELILEIFSHFSPVEIFNFYSMLFIDQIPETEISEQYIFDKFLKNTLLSYLRVLWDRRLLTIEVVFNVDYLRETLVSDNIFLRIDFLIANGFNGWNAGLSAAVKNNNLSCINFFIEKGADDWQRGLMMASNIGNIELAKMFISLGAKLIPGLYLAARQGHVQFVRFYLPEIENNPEFSWNVNQIMARAAEKGCREIIDLAIGKGANNWNLGMSMAIQKNHSNLIDFFIEKGANDWNWGMIIAALTGNQKLVEFFIIKGANNWNKGLVNATMGNHQELVEFFIMKGADDLEEGMKIAISCDYEGLVEFFKKKMKLI